MIRMITNCIPTRSLILSGLLIVLVAVSTSAVWAQGWRSVPIDRPQIDMYVPGMESWNPGYGKTVDDGRNQGTSTKTKWRVFDEPGIHAFLTYQTRGVYPFTYYKIKDFVRFFVKKEHFLSFDGKKKTYKAKLGKFEYIYFSAKAETVNRRCVGFSNLYSGNKKMIYGHYCLSNDEPIREDIVGSIIDSITLNVD